MPTLKYEISPPTPAPSPCERTIRAHVVALDQVFFWNRLGAVQPHGMIFALRHHVVPTDGTNTLKPGKVRLRADKRPRPLVLRMNVGDCLQIDFQNLLLPEPRHEDQPATRTASIHVAGLQLVNSIRDDGSNVGHNPSPPGGLVAPGGRITYTLYADSQMREGSHILFSAAATTTAEGDGGQIPPGLFGAVNVEPRGAEWYRSQLSHNDMRLASRRADGKIIRTESRPQANPPVNGGHPVIDYDAVYPSWHRYRGQPILKILNRHNVIVHSDLTAIITGPGRGKFPPNTYPPSTVAAPNRDWPFREQTLIYHDEIGAVQAFPQFEQEGPGQLGPTLHGSRDAFAINYGTGGIGAEILANRIGVGPMAECDECLFEEFFLSAWTVGDPAMVVDVPANAPCWPERLEKGECNGLHQNAAPGYKATKVFYPHDPSNVYHGYLNDHTKQRVLHAGPKEHHIHHLHAHQWFKSADGPEGSSYNDSQAIGPGSSHNIEIAYGGGGNRNLTAGDSIFHCHFYPHFAQGMWALWRVHDVFEEGTPLDRAGRPARGSRALPDAEIKRGTPIPAIVPLPGKLVLDERGKEDKEKTVNYVMPPMPQARVQIVDGQVKVQPEPDMPLGNPGFPFFVPGIAGRRVPHPPLDLAFDIVKEEGTGREVRRYRDGGLPRHIIQDARVASHEETRFSFDKVIADINAIRLPEEGDRVEQEAMKYHEHDFHVSYRADGSRGPFMTNGVGRALGAPYANPCVNHRWDRNGQPILKAEKFGRDVTYKGVMFQFDMKINKKGWHFPQSRIESLWEDWKPTISGDKPPEPLFFRANVNDCVTFHHANLIPKVYRQDDFQVRTPTDIVGQHIHLVKFDVTSSDGAANGWNYEDGTFGPEEVEHRIEEINKMQGLLNPDGTRDELKVRDDPFFGVPTQVTIQRWLIDNITPDATGDTNRTLRNAFTHDHFGPSTHQQTGLYAGLIIEPLGSDWFHNETGERLGRGSGAEAPRPEDGGPTSWQAVIIPPDKSQSYREFLLQVADFHLAYEEGGGVDRQGNAIPDPHRAINPPGRHEIPLSGNVTQPGGPFDPRNTRLLERPIRQQRGCPTGDSAERGCPEIISADDPGTFSVNYRNEPIPLRVRDPGRNTQAPNERGGDLSQVYQSIPRADSRLNLPGPYRPLTDDVGPYDPFTPLLRTGDGDRVQLRIFVGAHEEGHNFSVNGVKWLFEPFDPNSGWRNSQMLGISEKYDFILRGRAPQGNPGTVSLKDFLYRPGAAVDDQWNGVWGLLRTYQTAATQQRFFESQKRREELRRRQEELRQRGIQDTPLPVVAPFPLPTEVFTGRAAQDLRMGRLDPQQRLQKFDDKVNDGACPVDKKFSPRRSYEVFAYRAYDILPDQRLEFTGQNGHNFTLDPPSDDPLAGTPRSGPLNDPTAIVFVRSDHIGRDGKYNRRRVEPLVLRAVAGECIEVKLTNRLPEAPYDLPGYNTFPMIVDDFNANQVVPSRHVGLHPQLVHYDVRKGDGMNVGRNPVQTVGPRGTITYHWYAGDVGIDQGGNRRRATPVEFGAVNLSSSDPIKHSNKSAIGSLIIEPLGSKWTEDPDSTHAATVQPVACKNSPGQQPCPEKFKEFREFVIQFQNDLNLRFDDRSPVPNLAEAEDPEDSGQKAFNYRTEPFWTRLCYWTALPLTGGSGTATQCPQSNAESTRQLDMTNSLHNSLLRRPAPGPPDNQQAVEPDPVTPVFTAAPGVPVRFRVLHSGGHARNTTFMLHGHVWQEMPYRTVPPPAGTVRPDEPASNVIGFNPTSPWHGAQWGHGPSNHFDVVLPSAGGRFLVLGDYLYRTFQSFQFDGGMWGIFRVGPPSRGGGAIR